MAPGFKKKIIVSKDSLGLIFKKRRLRKKLSLDDAEKLTNIRSKFLEAIENNFWDELPSNVSARGYVERYSICLDLKRTEMMAMFDSSKHLYRHLCLDKIEASKTQRPITSMWLLTPKIVAFTLSLVIVSIVGGYIIWQVKSFAAAPELVIDFPSIDQKTQVNTDLLALKGKASPNSEIKINGTMVNINKDGSFEEKIGLTRGENIIAVIAKNRSQKFTAEMLTVIANY